MQIKILNTNLMKCSSILLKKLLIAMPKLIVNIFIGIILFTSCWTGSKSDTTLLMPQLQSEVTYFPGSLISGSAQIDTNSTTINKTLAVMVEMAALKQIPENSLEPLESYTDMITIVPADKIVVPTSSLTKGGRIGIVENAAQFFENVTNKNNGSAGYQILHGVLADGVTTNFRFFVPGREESQQPEGFSIQIYRKNSIKGQTAGEFLSGTSLEMALVANGKPRPDTAANSQTAGNPKKQNIEPEQPVQITETVILKKWLLEDGQHIGIILPSPFSAGNAGAFAVNISLFLPLKESTSEAEIHAESFKRFRDYVTGYDFRERNLQTAYKGAQWSGLEEAVLSLRYPMSRRQALLYLGQQTKVSVVEDIALTGTGKLLDNLSRTIIRDYPSGPVSDCNVLGWILERNAYTILKDMLSSEEITPELESILIRHTGEVGRHASTLEDVLTSSTCMEDFRNRLVGENLIYLEDMSPAARTRALEWLAVRNKAPKGFKPLASLKERQAVLSQLDKGKESK
jgi:hypothetical protein